MRRLRPVAWLVVVAGPTWVLHASGRAALARPPFTEPGRWGDWLSRGDPVVTAVALLRLPLLVLAWYAVAVTLAGLLGRAVRADGLVALVDCITLPALRRMIVAAAGGLTLASGPVLGGVAVAQTPPATTTTTLPTAVMPAHAPAPTLTMRLLAPGENPATTLARPSLGPSTTVAGPPAVPAIVAPTAGPPLAAAPPAAVAGQPATWTVRPGECFWSIAEVVVTEAWGRPPTNAEMIPYWHRLIAANRMALVDRGNPDLIYPGQVFEVPPVSL